MGISGNDVTLTQARFGGMRFGACRFGDFYPTLMASIGGVDGHLRIL